MIPNTKYLEIVRDDGSTETFTSVTKLEASEVIMESAKGNGTESREEVTIEHLGHHSTSIRLSGGQVGESQNFRNLKSVWVDELFITTLDGGTEVRNGVEIKHYGNSMSW